MSKLAQQNLFAFVWVAVFGAFIWASLGYSWKAALVPVPVCLFSIALLLVQVYLQNFRKDLKLTVDSMDMFAKNADPSLLEEDEEVEKEGTTRKELEIAGLILVYLGLVMGIGLIEATFLFILGYFKFIGKYKWITSLIYAVLTAVVLNLLFGTLLGLRMYDGWLMTTIFGT
jgi:hypothetical protein